MASIDNPSAPAKNALVSLPVDKLSPPAARWVASASDLARMARFGDVIWPSNMTLAPGAASKPAESEVVPSYDPDAVRSAAQSLDSSIKDGKVDAERILKKIWSLPPASVSALRRGSDSFIDRLERLQRKDKLNVVELERIKLALSGFNAPAMARRIKAHPGECLAEFPQLMPFQRYAVALEFDRLYGGKGALIRSLPEEDKIKAARLIYSPRVCDTAQFWALAARSLDTSERNAGTWAFGALQMQAGALREPMRSRMTMAQNLEDLAVAFETVAPAKGIQLDLSKEAAFNFARYLSRIAERPAIADSEAPWYFDVKPEKIGQRIEEMVKHLAAPASAPAATR